jgi:V/A-type H+-transporting ATPase subunit G/H
MVIEVLKSIKSAEEDAENNLKKAQSEGDKFVEIAKNKADNILQKSRENANNKARDIIKKVEKEAENESSSIIDDGNKEGSRIQDISKDKKTKASTMIISRITEV